MRRRTIEPAKVHTSSISPAPVQAAAALSFLKETRGLVDWSLKDLQKALLISAPAAREVISALELQGYVKQSEAAHAWITTINGEAVSGSKPPRFTRDAVERSLDALRERINSINKDALSAYRITEAVAFGDFLHGDAQAQAADVGIQLETSGAAENARARRSKSAVKSATAFLKTLRARDLKLSLLAYQPWMSERFHTNLLDRFSAKAKRRTAVSK